MVDFDLQLERARAAEFSADGQQLSVVLRTGEIDVYDLTTRARV